VRDGMQAGRHRGKGTDQTQEGRMKRFHVHVSVDNTRKHGLLCGLIPRAKRFHS
jgi:hypothetical protein